MQVYRGMPILTQAPTKAECRRLKAHLVSFLDPSKEYNAALFRRDAKDAIEKIWKKGRLPLLTGGTGLYMRTLLYGIFEHADDGKDEAFRKKMLRGQEKEGGEYLHEKLKKIDPASASKIHPNDHRRLVRALEVHHATGKPMSEQKPHRKGLSEDCDFRIFLLDRERGDLYKRAEKRVDAMLRKGLLKEVRRLRRKKMSITASVALGFREMSAVLDKKMEAKEAAELLKKNTRHYAKRQLSWFRHEKGVELVPVGADEKPAETAKKVLKLWSNK